LVCCLALLGCEESKPEGPPPSRFQAVTRSSTVSDKAAKAFCEQTWQPGEKKWVTPPERAVPGPAGTPVKAGAWKWVNLWATWCKPCVEEMPLLDRWVKTLEKDGVAVGLELWSIDEEEPQLKSWLSKTTMPGHVRWLKDAEALGPTLESFGADKNSAIPIHVLVDGSNNLRCLRVGSVHDPDFGKVKSILGG
jgi:thiol-disulfide isomerase/thioredoxin